MCSMCYTLAQCTKLIGGGGPGGGGGGGGPKNVL